MPTPKPHAELRLERFLPYRLSVLSNRVSQDIARLYSARFNLSITEWRVMAVLGHERGLSANTVAERTAMDKVAVSRAVSALMGKKFRHGIFKGGTCGDCHLPSDVESDCKGPVQKGWRLKRRQPAFGPGIQ